MNVGDLVLITHSESELVAFPGLYLGIGSRGTERINDPSLLEFFWKGRIANFDIAYWDFRIISERYSNLCGLTQRGEYLVSVLKSGD